MFALLLAGCVGTDDYRIVKRVIDGDTFVLENGEKIRLTGVNAPESRKTGRKNVEYFGKESKLFLKQYLTGKDVRLEYDVTRTDKYNRTLAYVYLRDGTFLNAEIVRLGYATVYTVPPNVKYAELFLEMERDARENERGLWRGGYEPVRKETKHRKKKHKARAAI